MEKKISGTSLLVFVKWGFLFFFFHEYAKLAYLLIRRRSRNENKGGTSHDATKDVVKMVPEGARDEMLGSNRSYNMG